MIMRILICASLVLVPSVLCAGTAQAGPTFGWDDINTAELNPYVDGGPLYVLTCDWLTKALGHGLKDGNPVDEPDFANLAKWTFHFAEDKSVIFREDFKSIVYKPWVVQDLGLKVPGGKYTNPDHGDVGGADFSFVYAPQEGEIGFGDLRNVHFLQIIRTITTYQNEADGDQHTETNYFIDNLGDQSKPFADQVGANAQLPRGGIVNTRDGTPGKFFFDIPDRCEPFPYGYGDSNCEKDVDPALVSIDWEAQTLVAIDRPEGTLQDVTLYGGLWWGFKYTNEDVPGAPEPASSILTVVALSGLVLKVSRAKRRPVSEPSKLSDNTVNQRVGALRFAGSPPSCAQQ
jgi:hypothetical protein